MKPFISKNFYGVINWVGCFALMGAPWYWGFWTVGGAALLMPMFFGWLQFIMAVFSNNKHGLIRVFPMQMHFFLDVIMGSFLLASPWVYGFDNRVFWPQVILGGILFLAGIFTHESPFTTKPYHHMPEGQLQSVDSE